jgi:REP element-mobilizing transposase RayT
MFFMEIPTIKKRQGAFLPHWTKPSGIYSMCFRLTDSVPQETLREWIAERADIVRMAKAMRRNLSEEEWLRLQELHSERKERYIRNGYGACWLQQKDIASLVRDALLFFNGIRYRLFAWCIMPNHVHSVVQPIPPHSLSTILHSWKSYTGLVANRRLGRSGNFWRQESHDHLVRNADDPRRVIAYTWNNPDAAGLPDWRWRWKMSDEELRTFVETQAHAFVDA